MSPSSVDPARPPAPRGRWTGAVVTLLVLALLVAGAWWLVERANRPSGGPVSPGGAPATAGFGGAMPSVTVGVASAVQGELPIRIDALGTVTPPQMATLVPQVSGVLSEVLFTEGQSVKKGQVLARIDSRTYDQALAQAKAQTARDQAQLAAARVTLARYEELWKQDSIARQTLDTQTALVRQLEATVQSDRASEQAAQLNVGFTVIRAPIAGVIGLRAVDPGNLVSSGTSTGIATITQVQPIDVVFSVPQDQVPAVLEAQRASKLPVTVFDRARSEPLAEGSFLTLDNQVNVATGTVRAKARFDNTDGRLFPNQFVNARLQLGVVRGLLVPVTAVRTGPQGAYVYVIDPERVAHMRPVTRGMATAEQILITDGLQAGERVVTEGGDRVKDGSKVQLAGEGSAGGARSGGAGQSAPGAAPASPGPAAGARTDPRAAGAAASAPAGAAAQAH